MSTTADPALEAATWDLEPLVGSRGAEGVEELLVEARERAAAFGSATAAGWPSWTPPGSPTP